MNQSKQENWTLTVPLSLAAHRAAESFCQELEDTPKARQVYLNTLAVYAVYSYLSYLGIDTDLTASSAWNPIFRALSDVADLVVTDRGKLECRPVLPDAPFCRVPPEVWANRIGYLVVQLNLSSRVATLLGFTPSVDAEELPFNRLRPLEDLLIHLKQLNGVVHLSGWLDCVFESGWEAVEILLAWQPTGLAFHFRGDSTVEAGATSLAEMEVKRGKIIEFERASERALLLVGLEPIDAITMGILMKVCSCEEQVNLPQGLQIRVIDELGEAVMQAQARNTNWVALRFCGERGERFNVQFLLGDISITEAFAI